MADENEEDAQDLVDYEQPDAGAGDDSGHGPAQQGDGTGLKVWLGGIPFGTTESDLAALAAEHVPGSSPDCLAKSGFAFLVRTRCLGSAWLAAFFRAGPLPIPTFLRTIGYFCI